MAVAAVGKPPTYPPHFDHATISVITAAIRMFTASTRLNVRLPNFTHGDHPAGHLRGAACCGGWRTSDALAGEASAVSSLYPVPIKLPNGAEVGRPHRASIDSSMRLATFL